MNKYDLVNNFVQNMETERYNRGLTQVEMAKILEMSPSAYRKIISGDTNNISINTIFKMHDLTGQYLFEMADVDNRLSQIVKMCHGLSDRQLSFIEHIVRFENEFAGQDNIEVELGVITPMGRIEDGMIWDTPKLEKIKINPSLASKATCGVRITSNHFSPAYTIGDILLIENKPPHDNDIGIFVNKETCCAYIRKFKQAEPCRLEPLSNFGDVIYVDEYDPEEVSKWVRFGRVICKIR